MVVLTNGMPIGVPETLADQIIDQIVTGGQTRTGSAYWYEIFSGLSVEDPALSKVPDPPTPARPLDAYLGSYANDFYGTFEVVADGTGMALVQGPARVTSPLTHWDGDTFTFIRGPASPEHPGPAHVHGRRRTGVRRRSPSPTPTSARCNARQHRALAAAAPRRRP